jgi:hypothetical protein
VSLPRFLTFWDLDHKYFDFQDVGSSIGTSNDIKHRQRLLRQREWMDLHVEVLESGRD